MNRIARKDVHERKVELERRIIHQKQRRDKTLTLLQDIERRLSVSSGKNISYLRKNKETVSFLLHEETSTLQRMQKEQYLLSQRSAAKKKEQLSVEKIRYGLGLFAVLLLFIFCAALFRFMVVDEDVITGAASLDILEAPTSNNPILNSTDPTRNDTNQNLTVYPQNVSDADNDAIKNITNWILNGSSIMRLNLPFEGLNSSTTNASDYSGNQNNLTLNGNVVWNQTGGYDGRGAYLLDGIDATLNRSYDTDFDFGSGNFTVVGWFKTGLLAPGGTISRKLVSSTNDAEEPETGGTVSTTSSDLELAEDTGTKQRVGVRFTNISIPQGALIVDAVITFTADSVQSGALNLEFIGELNYVPGNFTTASRNLVDRANTTARVNWINVPSWSTGVNYTTPNLATIIQEMTNHSEWTSGNPLVIFIHGNSSTTLRKAYAYNGNTQLAATLNITYRNPQYLVSRYDADQGFKVWMSSGGTVSAGLDDDLAWLPDVTVKSETVYNDSTWHFFSLVKNNNTNVTLYVDSALVGQNTSLPAIVSNVSYNITQSADDAEERLDTNSMDTGGSSLEMVMDPNTDVNFTVGLRYQNVDVPQGATIINAIVRFTADSVNTSPGVNLTFYGENVDNASVFGTNAGNITNRTVTAASVIWTEVGSWSTIKDSGLNQTSPNLTSIIQEIVNRANWVRGNSLVLIINGTPGTTRSADSGNAGKKPAVLNVNYTFPLATLTSDSAPLVLGSNRPTAELYFNGTLDEVKIFNRSLTAEQIAALYNNRTNLIVSQELAVGDNWTADVTPNDVTTNGTTQRSNSVIILAPSAGDSTRPNVTTLVPSLNSVFNTSTTIEIGANVTDEGGVNIVYANLTSPNGTVTQLNLTNGTGYARKFNVSYPLPMQGGLYNITFFANDTSNNINASERTNFTALLACGSLTRNSNLQQNITSSGTCFSLATSHVFLNCSGYSITYGTGGSLAYAINNSGFVNVTVKNCILIEGTISGNINHAILFNNSATNGTIYNNTISLIASGSAGIHLAASSNYTNITSNTINTSGSSSPAIVLFNISQSNLTSNFLKTSGASATGVSLRASGNNSLFFNNITIIGLGVGIELTDTEVLGNILLNNSIFTGGNSSILDASGSSTFNQLVYNNTLGLINWTKTNLSTNLNLSVGTSIFLQNGLVGLVDNGNAQSNLNGSAKIEIKNLTYGSTPFLLKDGTRCDNKATLCNITSYDSTLGIVYANVSFFSNYTTQSGNNAPPAPVLLTPVTGNTTVNRTPTFVWNNSVDADGDNVTYNLVIDDSSTFNNPEVNVSGITNITARNTTYTTTTILAVDTTYFWQVRGNDGAANGSFSSSRNFTVNSFLALSILRSTVEFGSVSPGTNVTTVSDAPPFRAENTGNIFMNVSLNASNYFTRGSYPSQSYQFRIEENSSETNSFNTTLSNTTYINMSATNSTANVVNLDWQDIRDEFLVGLRLNVSTDEPPGLKSSTVTFTASS